ncbi:MAG: hypothetical protein PSV23_01840 [Brevundimonas sp.]|uniref:hypothetical protein n=1 Tax=Brevundimonas sp. TaxID=1871086 RepID=UPI00248A4892|nr:hypothetical protein [Brevundimonas sp.]MDI1325518.1 hypothetical protein [Brevundimonas sp.]
MKTFFSSTLLLGTASVVHAMRVIILSLLLGNREFGTVSTILLISTLFAEFGSLGFSQLVYNQGLYTPRIISRASVNVSRFLLTGLSIVSTMAVMTALVISTAGLFHFWTLFPTLICAAANVMILASCRASNNKFTHPAAYFLKSLIVLIDIAVLGSGHFAIDTIMLWGEILATPVLLFYAMRSGILRPRWSVLRKLPSLVAAHRNVAFWAIMSSMTALLFLNQERIAGGSFLTLEQMGIITKIILIKIIGGQSAFILGTYFHRHIVGSGQAGRVRSFAIIRRYEFWAYSAVALICLAMTIPVQWAYKAFYDIELTYAVAISAMVLGIVFFFNPFAILLQASGKFGTIARYNAVAVTLFMILAIFSVDSSYVVITSAATSLLWYILVRRAAYRLL